MSSVAPERAGRELTRGSDTFQARLFTEDIVFASNDPGVLGLISETPDAQDELDDDEVCNPIQRRWGAETIRRIDKG